MIRRFPRQSLVEAVELYEPAVREREALAERLKQMCVERRLNEPPTDPREVEASRIDGATTSPRPLTNSMAKNKVNKED